MPETTPKHPAAHSPSNSLFANLRADLMRTLPFSRMALAHVDEFIAGARQAYFAPGEVLLEPGTGPVTHLYLVRHGSVTGKRAIADAQAALEYVPGDLFPVGAVLAQRAANARYVANEDTFCLLLAADAVQALAARSAPFAEFLNHRIEQILDASRRVLQANYTSQTLAEQSLEAGLGTLARKTPLSCTALTPLATALTEMQQRHVGSVVVVDAAGAPCGILTRHDIVGRVTLPQLPLSTAIGEVMSAPIHTLSTEHTLQDAALLMSRHGVRHVPVTAQGRLINIVSERDLFALQRLSLKQLSTQLRSAPDIAALKLLAAQIRRFARGLLGQGVHARQLTELISHLNDVLTHRLVQLVGSRRGLDLTQACWLAFGSEGRGEQTIATDQDNGLLFLANDAGRDRPAWLAFGREVNDALDACGYPLCKGNVMASNPACCLTPDEWQHSFGHWIANGSPQDLLNASIYFDLRTLSGNPALVQPLRDMITREAARVPRFLKQMADNCLTRRAALNWRGAIDTQELDGRDMFDLKLQGTAIFVDSARLYALAHGVPALATRARLEAVAPLLGVPPQEGQSWVSAFEFLQMLRLQLQLGPVQAAGAAAASISPQAQGNPNLIDMGTLNDIDRSMLKEACKVARRLQQRLELDYQR
jgi:CBS domain-containing protein